MPGLIGSAGSTGTDGNDIINATTAFLPGTATKANTLSSLDNLNGGLGSNKLVISDTDTNFTLATGIKLSNIQAITIAAAGGATADITPSTITGVTSLAVTQATSAALTAGATTDVNVSGAAATVAVTGGKTVSVNHALNTAGDSIAVNGAVGVTVVATDVIDAAGINIGTTKANTDAISVTSTGAKIVGGTTGTINMDQIAVTGGTTISVTQAATADMGDVATKGALTDVVTQGTVTVVGSAATTSVSVVQADQAVAKAAVAAVAGVSATQVVTFKSMASGASITIDGLTFTANKALTAVEAAAAFAGLTAVENQGQGFSSNGFYTNATSTNFNSSAVSGATVTYTQKVAGTGGALVISATGNDNETVPAPLTGTIIAVAGATAVTAVPGVTGVLGVANGAVVIDDNAGTASIKTVVVDGYSAGASLGATKDLNALTTLTLANSGVGTATVKTNAVALDLTVNDVTAGVTIAIAIQNAAKRLDFESSQERKLWDARFPQRRSTILPQISPQDGA